MKTKEEVEKMGKGLNFLKRVQRVLAVAEARKTEAVEKVGGFGNRYSDREKVVHSAMILNPFMIDENSIDKYVFGGPDTTETLYTTRKRGVESFLHELDEYRHVNPERGVSGKRKGSILYREAREKHSIFKSMLEGVNRLRDAESDYIAEILGGKEPSPEEKGGLRQHVVVFAVSKIEKYGEGITFKGVVDAYTNSYSKLEIEKMASNSSKRRWV